KYGGLFLSTKIKDLSYIFSLVAKSDMQVSCVIFFERKIQGSALAGSYISLEKVILYLPQLTLWVNITLRSKI
ncbi:MAG: hypothetical protein J6Q52_01925, partial [Clostridia bacterium]|nr:hypothetical protein [Clostridia bacterium]